MITLSHLRALLGRALTHTDNPAILRLPEEERTVEGLAMAYLARRIYWLRADGVTDETCHAATLSALRCWGTVVSTRLDLTDPGTAHALLVALALALGLDPGVGALDVFWARLTPNGWTVQQFARGVTFNDHWRVPGGVMQHKCAPTVAAEPDPVRALALAVAHVLEAAP